MSLLARRTRTGRLLGCLLLAAVPASAEGLSPISAEERVEYIRRAEVWAPIETESLDIRQGPPLEDDPSTDGELVCRFQIPERKPGGRSPKLYCRTADGRLRKIKYGVENREVYGEIAGSRFLWALGFKTDHLQPVRVRCLGCPEDPWDFLKGIDDWDDPPSVPDAADRVFEPAALEFWYADLIETEEDEGVAWDEILELRSLDPEVAERQRVHREALTLAAAFMQHADSKAPNQTLGCAPGGVVAEEAGRRVCSRPVIYIGDLGAIGGYGWDPFRRLSLEGLASPSKIRHGETVPLWRDPETCSIRVNPLPNATLRRANISEEGRSFLADRLSRLSRDQLLAIVELSRVDLLGTEIETPDGGRRPVTSEDRVRKMEDRIREVLDHRCPAS